MNTRRRSCFSPRYGDTKYTELEPSQSSTVESLSPTYIVYSPKFENEPFRTSHDSVNTAVSSSPTEYTCVYQNSGQRTLRQRTASGTPSESSHSAEAKLPISIKSRGLLNRRLRRPSKVIPICGLCLGTSELNNKTNSAEEMIACWECGQSGHPTCLKMPPDLVKRISTIRWLCVDCKRCCLCQPSTENQNPPLVKEDPQYDLLLCDVCDRGFHLKCAEPNMLEPPEGMWTCPICSQSSSDCLNIDPRLRSIQVCDQLTQHEIDWMKKAANVSGVYLTAPLSFSCEQSSETVNRCSYVLQSSKPSFPTLSKSEAKQPPIPHENNQIDDNSTTVSKPSRRLVQKSLTDWTKKPTDSIEASRQIENTTNQMTTESETIKVDNTPRRVSRLRRSSLCANLAWQGLLRSCDRSKPMQDKSLESSKKILNGKGDNNDKTDFSGDRNIASYALFNNKVSTNETKMKKYFKRTLSPRSTGNFVRSKAKQNKTGPPEELSPILSTRSGTSVGLFNREALRTPSGKSNESQGKRYIPSQSNRLLNSRKMNSRCKTRNSLKHRLSRLSTNDNVNEKTNNWLKLSSSHNHLRQQTIPASINSKLSVSRGGGRRHFNKYKRSYYYRNRRKPLRRHIFSDDSVYEGDDDDDSSDEVGSSGTVSAGHRVGDFSATGKKLISKTNINSSGDCNTHILSTSNNNSATYFDSENDEAPEMNQISDENRALFHSIQVDVQACLPQPLESSLSLPPANNPKVLAAMDNASLNNLSSNQLTSNDCNEKDNQQQQLDKPEDSRYPPQIQLGRYIITTWYSAPYPSEYARLTLLYICEFCLKYIKTRNVYLRHIEKCPYSFPPGNEIYRCKNISVFEVDGYTSRLYCQQLCLLAKLFLDHKTLYYDVEPFLFYVVTVHHNDVNTSKTDIDNERCFHLVGYFSKEKRSVQKYNLSCILVLPPYQKQAYGRFLIDFSFLLSRIEGQPGSPEKPLSQLGSLSYQSYWRSKVLPFLLCSMKDCKLNKSNIPNFDTDSDCLTNSLGSIGFRDFVITIHEISSTTGIDPHDVASTIQQLATTIRLNTDGKPIICFDLKYLLQLQEKYEKRSVNWIPIDEECLRWSPLVHPQELDISADSSGGGCDNSNPIMTHQYPSHLPSQDVDSSAVSKMNRITPSNYKTQSQSDEPSVNRENSYLKSFDVPRKRSLRSSSGNNSIISNISPVIMDNAAQSSRILQNLTDDNDKSYRRRLRSPPSSAHAVDNKLKEQTSPPTGSRSCASTHQSSSSKQLNSLVTTARHYSTDVKSSISCNRIVDSDDKPLHNSRKKDSKAKPHPSPCRKRSFCSDGPRPPDPPSPPGGGFISSNTYSIVTRTRRLSCNAPQRSATRNYSNTSNSKETTLFSTFTNYFDFSFGVPTYDIETSTTSTSCSSTLTTLNNNNFSLYNMKEKLIESGTIMQTTVDNSCLPSSEYIEISPLRPSFSSSPTTVLIKDDGNGSDVVENVDNVNYSVTSEHRKMNMNNQGQHIVDRPSLSPSSVRTPSPPMLSLADGLSAIDVELPTSSLSDAINNTCSNNTISFLAKSRHSFGNEMNNNNIPPPCLSLYDSGLLVVHSRSNGSSTNSPTSSSSSNSTTKAFDYSAVSNHHCLRHQHESIPLNCHPTSPSLHISQKFSSSFSIPLYVETNLGGDDEVENTEFTTAASNSRQCLLTSTSSSSEATIPQQPQQYKRHNRLLLQSDNSILTTLCSEISRHSFSDTGGTNRSHSLNPIMHVSLHNQRAKRRSPRSWPSSPTQLSASHKSAPSNYEFSTQDYSADNISVLDSESSSSSPPVLCRAVNNCTPVTAPLLVPFDPVDPHKLSTGNCQPLKNHLNHSPLPPVLITDEIKSGTISPIFTTSLTTHWDHQCDIRPPILLPLDSCEKRCSIDTVEKLTHPYISPYSSSTISSTHIDLSDNYTSDHSTVLTLPMTGEEHNNVNMRNIDYIEDSSCINQLVNFTTDTDGLTLIPASYDLVNNSDKSSLNSDNNSFCSQESSEQTIAMCLSDSESSPFLEDAQACFNKHTTKKERINLLLDKTLTYFNQMDAFHNDCNNNGLRSRHVSEPSNKMIMSMDMVCYPLETCRRCHSHPNLKFSTNPLLYNVVRSISEKVDIDTQPTLHSPVIHHSSSSMKEQSEDYLIKVSVDLLNSPLFTENINNTTSSESMLIISNHHHYKSPPCLSQSPPLSLCSHSSVMNTKLLSDVIDNHNTELTDLNVSRSISPSSSSCSPASSYSSIFKSAVISSNNAVSSLYTSVSKSIENRNTLTPTINTSSMTTVNSLCYLNSTHTSKALDMHNISFPDEEMGFLTDSNVHLPSVSSTCMIYSDNLMVNSSTPLSTVSSLVTSDSCIQSVIANKYNPVTTSSIVCVDATEHNSITSQHYSPSFYPTSSKSHYLSEYISPEKESIPDHVPDFNSTELTNIHLHVENNNLRDNIDVRNALMNKEFFHTPLSNHEDKTLLCDTDDILSESSNFVSPDTDQLVCGSTHSYSSSVLSNILDQSDSVMMTSTTVTTANDNSFTTNHLSKPCDVNLLNINYPGQLSSLPLINTEVFSVTTCTSTAVIPSQSSKYCVNNISNVPLSQFPVIRQSTGLESCNITSALCQLQQQPPNVYDMMSIRTHSPPPTTKTRSRTKRGGATTCAKKGSKTACKQPLSHSSVLPASSLSVPWLECDPVNSSQHSRHTSYQVVPMNESAFNIPYNRYNTLDVCNSTSFPSVVVCHSLTHGEMTHHKSQNNNLSNSYLCGISNPIGTCEPLHLPTTSYCYLTPMVSYNVNVSAQQSFNTYSNFQSSNQVCGTDRVPCSVSNLPNSCNLERQLSNVPIPPNYQCNSSSFPFVHHSDTQSFIPSAVVNQFIPDIVNTNSCHSLPADRILHMNSNQQPSTPVYPDYSGDFSFPLVTCTNDSIASNLQLSTTPAVGCTLSPQTNNSVLIKPDYLNYSGTCNLTQSSVPPCTERVLDSCNMNNSTPLTQLTGTYCSVIQQQLPSFQNIPPNFMSNIPSNISSNQFITTTTGAVTLTTTSHISYPGVLNTTCKNDNNRISISRHQLSQQDIISPNIISPLSTVVVDTYHQKDALYDSNPNNYYHYCYNDSQSNLSLLDSSVVMQSPPLVGWAPTDLVNRTGHFTQIPYHPMPT
ncbi:hypothetical protein MN116_007660 [Schistosoma mekongi]|uniref:histone acetyltransferase n=1 Tax=Schistosoma mekongi TaxID=38744 RepID=A0AAE1Z6I2_SCHME|nr:hypothetical protein MN116_007660 [Schistosoma mekongi]